MFKKSDIAKYENEFIKKISIFISIIAERKSITYNDYGILSVTKYNVHVSDNIIFDYFILWINAKLKEMGYDENQITGFFQKDMPGIIQKGLDKKNDAENKEKKFSYGGCIISILILIGIFEGINGIYNHVKYKKYAEIKNNVYTDFRKKAKDINNIDKVLSIFDKYIDMI